MMPTQAYTSQVILPIISGPYPYAQPSPDTQTYFLLPHLPPLTHAMPELAMGGKPWGQKQASQG